MESSVYAPFSQKALKLSEILISNGMPLVSIDGEAGEVCIKRIVSIVGEANGRCFACEHELRPSLPTYVPMNVLKDDAEEHLRVSDTNERAALRKLQGKKYAEYFLNEFVANELRKIGMHPAELTIVIPIKCVNGQLSAPPCIGEMELRTAIHELIRLRKTLDEE